MFRALIPLLLLGACSSPLIPPRPAVDGLTDAPSAGWQGRGYVDAVWVAESSPVDAENPAILMVACYRGSVVGTDLARSVMVTVFPAGFTHSSVAELSFQPKSSKARTLGVKEVDGFSASFTGLGARALANHLKSVDQATLLSRELFNANTAKFITKDLPTLSCVK